MSKSVYFVVSFLLIQLYIANVSAKIEFNQSILKTDYKITHPVRKANLLGGEHEQLVVIGENQSKQTIMVVYQLEVAKQQYQEFSRIVIPENFLIYDILQANARQKLIFQTNQSLFEYRISDNQFSNIAKANSIYLQPKAQFLVSKDFIKDINDDELDDIIIVDFSVVHIFLQTQTGEFKQQTLPILPKMQSEENSSEFTETPLFFADFNLDNRSDIAVVIDAGLRIYQQDEQGMFATESNEIKLPFDIKALNWWEIKEADGKTVDQNKLSHRSMHRTRDVNGDNIVDLLVKFSQSEGLLERQNNFEVYLGQTVDGQLKFSETADSVISADGTVSNVKLIDLDDDKQLEIMVASLDIGVAQIIGALMSGSIDQDIYLFKMGADGHYLEEPSAEKEVELNFSLSSGKSGAPVVKAADFDGDGIKDIMLSNGEKKLKIFQGRNNKRLFKKRSDKYKILLPKDGNLVEVMDLNNDAKEDIIIRYGRQDDEKLSQQLVILFAS